MIILYKYSAKAAQYRSLVHTTIGGRKFGIPQVLPYGLMASKNGGTRLHFHGARPVFLEILNPHRWRHIIPY